MSTVHVSLFLRENTLVTVLLRVYSGGLLSSAVNPVAKLAWIRDEIAYKMQRNDWLCGDAVAACWITTVTIYETVECSNTASANRLQNDTN